MTRIQIFEIEAILKSRVLFDAVPILEKKTTQKTQKSLSSSSSIPAPSPLNIMGLGTLRLAPHTHTLAF